MFSLLRKKMLSAVLPLALLTASGSMAAAAYWPAIPAAANMDAVQDGKTVLLTAGPNPFTESIHVQLSGNLNNQNIEVRVLNVIGRVVFSFNGPASQLDALLSGQSSKWPKGYYYLVVASPDNPNAQTLRLQKL